MRPTSIRALFLTGLVALLALPVGFAVAQVVQDQSSGEAGEWRHLDPDPSTDPVAMGNRLAEAQASGNAAELDRVTAEIREELISHLGPEERAAAESASPEPDVPAGTVAYIAPSIVPALVDDCVEKVKEGTADALCKLVVLHSEGRVRAGAFSAEQVAEALGEQASGEAK